jgi:hypothetical protein
VSRCDIDDCDQHHCIRCGSCMPWWGGPATTCQGCDIDDEVAEENAMSEAECEANNRARLWLDD